MPRRLLLVVMGVTGSGKSTVGALLAERLGCDFVDGDTLHSPENVAKMSSGVPLSDADRGPWLHAVGRQLAHAKASERDVVIACSALRRVYRTLILAEEPAATFVHLTGTHDELRHRLVTRTSHFMPPSLLDTQLAILEPLEADERGLTVSVAGAAGRVVDDILAQLPPR